MKDIIINELPYREEGFYKIINFYNISNSIDQYMCMMDVIYLLPKGKEKPAGHTKNVPPCKVPIYLLLDVNIGDLFNATTKERFKRQNKLFKRKLDTKEMRLSKIKEDVFLNHKLNHKSLSLNSYYEIPYSSESDNRSRRILLSSVVIAQYFYLLQTKFIDLFLSNMIKDMLYEYKKDEIINIEGEKIGFFVYDNRENLKKITDETAEALSQYLFSNNDQLYSNLLKNSSEVHFNLIKNKSSNFDFSIPQLRNFEVIFEGDYYSTAQEVVFFVYKIRDLVVLSNISKVDKCEFFPKIDRRSPDKRNEKEERNGGKRIRFRKAKDAGNKRDTSPIDNSSGTLDETSEENRFKYLDVEKRERKDQYFKYVSQGIIDIEISGNSSHNNLSEKDSGVSKSNTAKVPINSIQVVFMISVFNQLKKKLEKRIFIVDHTDKYLLLRILFEDKNFYFLADAVSDRIRVIHNINYEKIEKKNLHQVFEKYEQIGYDWYNFKLNEKNMDSLVFPPSINIGSRDMKKTIKLVSKRIGLK